MPLYSVWGRLLKQSPSWRQGSSRMQRGVIVWLWQWWTDGAWTPPPQPQHTETYGTHKASRCKQFGPSLQQKVPALQVYVSAGTKPVWLFALLPQIELYAPAVCHFGLQAQLLPLNTLNKSLCPFRTAVESSFLPWKLKRQYFFSKCI